MRRRVVVLGATGSVGKSVIDVLSKNKNYFEVVGLSVYRNISSLEELISEFNPEGVCVVDSTKVKLLKPIYDLKLFCSPAGISELLEYTSPDIVVVGIGGTEGLIPSKEAIQFAKKKAIIACKEAIVAAGELLLKYAKEKNITLLPLDSEPIGLLLALRAYKKEDIERIYLTASGGALWNKKIFSDKFMPEDVLAHPIWKMGRKITVDSANFMNKGFEVCEANILFGIPTDRIKVLVHPEAIIHAIVEGKDGTLLASMYYHDMRVAAKVALFWEEPFFEEKKDSLYKLNLETMNLSFHPVPEAYQSCLKLAYIVAEKKDVYPAILVGADDVAVHRFLSGNLAFLDIPNLLYSVIERYDTSCFFESMEFSWEKVELAIAWAKEQAYKYK